MAAELGKLVRRLARDDCRLKEAGNVDQVPPAAERCRVGVHVLMEELPVPPPVKHLGKPCRERDPRDLRAVRGEAIHDLAKVHQIQLARIGRRRPKGLDHRVYHLLVLRAGLVVQHTELGLPKLADHCERGAHVRTLPHRFGRGVARLNHHFRRGRRAALHRVQSEQQRSRRLVAPRNRCTAGEDLCGVEQAGQEPSLVDVAQSERCAEVVQLAGPFGCELPPAGFRPAPLFAHGAKGLEPRVVLCHQRLGLLAQQPRPPEVACRVPVKVGASSLSDGGAIAVAMHNHCHLQFVRLWGKRRPLLGQHSIGTVRLVNFRLGLAHCNPGGNRPSGDSSSASPGPPEQPTEHGPARG
mmetsp:Transcript_3215/g.7844  ORF Transcript_3215/g.7844 Transcript_3215/m.7844 type:complete len:354 (+) Transcript_3215:442-1503(+)